MPSVDGSSLVGSSGEDRVFRYLGLWINLRLDWTVQIARMDGWFGLCVPRSGGISST